MFKFGRKNDPPKPVPPPEEVRTRESPSVWAVTLGQVFRTPGNLPTGDYVYQVVAIRDGLRSSPKIARAATHVDGSAVSLTIVRGGDYSERSPDSYVIMRENKEIAEIQAAPDLHTDFLDTGEDLKEDQ